MRLVSIQRVLHPCDLDKYRAILAPTGVISWGGCGSPSTSLGSVRDERSIFSRSLAPSQPRVASCKMTWTMWRRRKATSCVTYSEHSTLFWVACVTEDSYLVDPASSHMLVSKIKPCMCKYKLFCTVKLRMAH